MEFEKQILYREYAFFSLYDIMIQLFLLKVNETKRFFVIFASILKRVRKTSREKLKWCKNVSMITHPSALLVFIQLFIILSNANVCAYVPCRRGSLRGRTTNRFQALNENLRVAQGCLDYRRTHLNSGLGFDDS